MLLSNYQKVYKNYCISYLSDNFIYPIILSNLRPEIENVYNNLNIYYCYKGIIYEKFKNKKNIISKEFLELNYNNFGYVYEIKEDFINSEIEELINFDKINAYSQKIKKDSNKCLLIKSNLTKTLNNEDVEKIKIFVNKKGFILVENVVNINEIGAVAGIESPELFSAAFYGLPTYLIEKYAVNLNVYKKLFKNKEILSY